MLSDRLRSPAVSTHLFAAIDARIAPLFASCSSPQPACWQASPLRVRLRSQRSPLWPEPCCHRPPHCLS